MKDQEPNSYSTNWFEFFHVTIPAERTEREVAFIRNLCPLATYPRIADVCCGMGRHAKALAASGYAVTGVERDAQAVEKARAAEGGPNYIQIDVRDYRPKTDSFDAAVVMSQSFGFFDAATNRGVFCSLATGLRSGGRIILDLWNPEFFLIHQGHRRFKMDGGFVQENKRVVGDRLLVELEYPTGFIENFEWQIFSVPNLEALGLSAGLMLFAACAEFDLQVAPSADSPKMQCVLDRR